MKISIVTVVLNDEKNIEKTILSVINQDYINVEYIVVDGGSTDGTIDVIRKYENRINVVLSEEDNGIYFAMNKSLSYLTGDYVAFMNSGDTYYNHNVLSSIFTAGCDVSADVIYGKTLTSRNTVKGPQRVIHEPHKIKNITNGRMIFVHQSSFVKRELLLRYRFEETYMIHADYNFFLTVFLNNGKFFRSNSIISVYQRGGKSSQNSLTGLREKIKILKRNNLPHLHLLKHVPMILLTKIFFVLASNYNMLKRFQFFSKNKKRKAS